MLRGRSTVTEYVYDDRGRLTHTVTESPWSDEDRALMLGYRQYLASLCPGCGEPKERAWHPEMEGWYQASRIECHGCKAKGNPDYRYTLTREDPGAVTENGDLSELRLSWQDPDDMPSLSNDQDQHRDEGGLDG